MSFVSGSVKINYMHLSLLICVSNVCREGTHNFCSSARVAKHATGNTAWEQLTGSVWFLSLSLPNTPCKKPCVFLCILQHPDKVIHILHSKHILIKLILAQVHGSSSFGIEQRSGQNVCLVVGWGSPCATLLCTCRNQANTSSHIRFDFSSCFCTFWATLLCCYAQYVIIVNCIYSNLQL